MGYTRGFQAGGSQGFDQGTRIARGEWEGDGDSPEARTRPKKSKKHRGGGKAWEGKDYTLADMDTKEDIFAARTGKNSYCVYPEAIQKELRDKYTAILASGPSQEILYEMNTGWAFLFSNSG